MSVVRLDRMFSWSVYEEEEEKAVAGDAYVRGKRQGINEN